MRSHYPGEIIMKIRLSAAAALAAVALFAVACVPPTEPPTTTTTTTTTTPPESTVDQSYADLPVSNLTLLRTNDTFGQTRKHAQVFTAGRGGVLDKVSAIVGSNGVGPIVPVTITVQSLDGTGRPSGTVLGQGVWNGPALPDANTFADIPLDDTADVVAGVQYALVFENLASSPTMALYLDDPNYPGGQSFEWFSVGGASEFWFADQYYDVPFKTWVR
jgi:hypothetical protein